MGGAGEGLKVICVLQARLASSRLPGKALRLVAGQPALVRMFNRLRRVPSVDSIIVATSPDLSNDPIRVLCAVQHITCLTGGLHDRDVAGRFRAVGDVTDADALVRISADCWLVFPELVDQVVREWRSHPDADYVSNCWPRSWPDGCDVEVLSRRLLPRLSGEDLTIQIWQNPGAYRLRSVTRQPDLSAWRWVVDYYEDVAFAEFAYTHLGDEFSVEGLIPWCQCGCGQRTAIATTTSTRHEWIRGLPKPFHGKHRLRRHPWSLRFWRRVDRSEAGCWRWPGYKIWNGYGRVKRAKDRGILAHRLAYEFAVGPIPVGLDVLHRCDVRDCVRPEHLYVGTDADNQRDRYARGRGVSGLTDIDIHNMRSRLAAGWTRRTVAAAYGISRSMASAIALGKRRA